MAESAKKAQLRKNWSSAMARTNGGSREDTAIQNVVDPPATPSNEFDAEQVRYSKELRLRKQTVKPTKEAEPTEVNKPAPKGKPVRPIQNNTMQPLQKANKNAKSFQKHVLFALVSAFLIKLVAGGRLLPTK